MESLEKKHIKTLEEAVEQLRTNNYKNEPLIGRINRVIGYLMAKEEMRNAKKACCSNGKIVRPGCNGKKPVEYSVNCAGCKGTGVVNCGKCGGYEK